MIDIELYQRANKVKEEFRKNGGKVNSIHYDHYTRVFIEFKNT